MWENLLLMVHVMLAVAMIGLILLQQGKGAEAGASFGAGSSQTVFGSAGSASFLTKVTWWLAGLFFATSLTLAWVAHVHVTSKSAGIPGLDVAPPAASAPVGKLLSDVPSLPAIGKPAAPAKNGDVPALPVAPAGSAR